MSQSGPQDPTLSAFNNRNARDNELKNALKQRLEQQQQLMSQFRKPAEEYPKVGGIAGKFFHLADLNAESLAGQVAMQVIFDFFCLFIQYEWRVDSNIYKAAKNAGLQYTGEQTIYKCDFQGKPDFNKPYQPGEKPSIFDIYRNGYIPPATFMQFLNKQISSSVEGYMGTNTLDHETLTMMFGALTADRIKQKAKADAQNGKDDVSDMAAMRGMRPPASSGS